MEPTTRPLIRRTVQTALGIAIAALLLAGLAATPAGAAPRDPSRQQGVDAANEYIDYCIANGGDPVVIMDSTGSSLTVVCRWPSGQTSVCSFLPARSRCDTLEPSAHQTQVLASGRATAVAIRSGTHLALSGR